MAKAKSAETENADREATETLVPTARLKRAFDRLMSAVEQRLSAGEEGSAADRERDARTLSVLVRILEKLQDLDSAAREPEYDQSSESAADPHFDIRMCQELERRIRRLLEAEPAGGDLEGADEA